MASETYRVKKHPTNGLWYALGRAGNSVTRLYQDRAYWVPVSDGYAKRADAESYAAMLPKSDAAMRREVLEADHRP